jgi:hypothetical protein
MNLDHKKQVKMHWLQHPDQSNLDNLNNTRREDSRHFRNKEQTYLISKSTNLKIRQKNSRDWYRGVSDFRKSCQPRNDGV